MNTDDFLLLSSKYTTLGSSESCFERIQVGEEIKPLYKATPERMLRILAQSQFDDPYLAFREIYANALDAVRDRTNGIIKISVSQQKISVEDNGCGLDEQGYAALTTLGGSTKRQTPDSNIGYFGIGFVSLFDPMLKIAEVRFLAKSSIHQANKNIPQGVLIVFTPVAEGGVQITTEPKNPPALGGSCVEITFLEETDSSHRYSRIYQIFETYASYSGVLTYLNEKKLSRDLSSYIDDEVRRKNIIGPAKKIIKVSTVQSSIGSATISPGMFDISFKVYQNGCFICDQALPRPVGIPWPKSSFGAVHSSGLRLVASRNAIIQDEAHTRLLEELKQLVIEAAYRLVRYYEVHHDAAARTILLDALRRGLRTTAPQALIAASTDLFSSALIRCPIFKSWTSSRLYSFEELVHLEQQGQFLALPYAPHTRDAQHNPVIKSTEALERDIFKYLSHLKEMPNIARGEAIAKPNWWSRIQDRLLSGPRAEYSLFKNNIPSNLISKDTKRLIQTIEGFLQTPAVHTAITKLIPGPLPKLSFGLSRNVFGPVAAYRYNEIRFNVGHRIIKKLSSSPDPDLALRALLPVIAHELAHMCHELHDLDFYRTSRVILRTLVVQAAEQDAKTINREYEYGKTSNNDNLW